MTDSVYENYIEGNPEEYDALKTNIRDWLRRNKTKSYPRTSEIARELLDEDELKGGFHSRLVAVAVDDLELEEWNPGAQNPRVKNPFAFGESV